MDRAVVNLLALNVLLLYPTGYWICEYFYADDINAWRSLRDTLNGVLIASLVLLTFLPKTRLKTASMWGLAVLCFGDLVDRLIFNIEVFVFSDWFLITIAAGVFLYKLKGNEPHTG